MAGYSTNPLAKKLGIYDGMRVYSKEMPQSVEEQLSEALSAATVFEILQDNMDFIIIFVKEQEAISKQIMVWKKKLAVTGMLWISWPKKTSQIETDISRDIVREIGLNSGLVDVKICAIDDDWSGLKFVYRKADR